MGFSADYRGQYKFDKPSLLIDICWFNTFLYHLLSVKKGDGYKQSYSNPQLPDDLKH